MKMMYYENKNYNNLNIIASRMFILCAVSYMIYILLIILNIISLPSPEEGGHGFPIVGAIGMWMMITPPSFILLVLMITKTKHRISKITKISISIFILSLISSILNLIYIFSLFNWNYIYFLISTIVLAIASLVILISYRRDLNKQGIEP